MEDSVSLAKIARRYFDSLVDQSSSFDALMNGAHNDLEGDYCRAVLDYVEMDIEKRAKHVELTAKQFESAESFEKAVVTARLPCMSIYEHYIRDVRVALKNRPWFEEGVNG